MRRVAALLLAAAPAAAYQASGQEWAQQDMPVPFYVSGSGSSPDITNGSDVLAVRDAFSEWQDVACAYITFRYMGSTGANVTSGNDGKNTLRWVAGTTTDPWRYSSSTLGVTTPLFYTTGEMIDADIVFNNRDYFWATGGSLQRTDVKSIALHEIGHFLGLDHSNTSSAVMYASYPGYVKDILTPDDVNGVCYVYPTSQQGTGRQGDTCSVDANCTSSLICAGPVGGSYKICTLKCPATCPGTLTCQSSTHGSDQACLNPPSQGGAGDLCDPCNEGVDCQSGLCVSDGQLSICTRACSGSAPCPTDYTCDPIDTGLSACWPQSGSCSGTATCPTVPCPPGQTCDNGACRVNTVPLGGACDPEPCNTDGLCVGSTSGDAHCRKPCTVGTDCPVGQSCRPLSSGGEACLPDEGGGGDKLLCQVCGSGGFDDCTADTFCVALTLANQNYGYICHKGCDPNVPASCPAGKCEEFSDGTNSSFICLCPQEVAKLNESCSQKLCAGGLTCVSLTGGPLCKQNCDPNNVACPPNQHCQTLQSGAGVCVDNPPDAGPADAGPKPDAGPGQDAGPKPDAGPGQDAGPTADAGPALDSGPAATDAGPAGADSGPAEEDAGPATGQDGGGGVTVISFGDAGTDAAGDDDRSVQIPREGGGCGGCGGAGGSSWMWALISLAALRLRRRTR